MRASEAVLAGTDWASVVGVPVAVYDFAERSAATGSGGGFCDGCPLAARGACQPEVAHQFGSYEADRWGGQYIYNCPANLAFVATVAYEGQTARQGLITGPIVLGSVEDLQPDLDPEMHEFVRTIPARTPRDLGSLARAQQRMCAGAAAADPAREATEAPLLEAAAAPRHPQATGNDYPFEEEQRLVGMIRRGDRAGAAERINQLLAVLYLSSNGNLTILRRGATELITLFSRAAIEGGADAAAIFGEKQTVDARLAGFTNLDDLSEFLVSVFHRFVGYVFDFSRFQHANALHQIVNYVRSNYSERITLAAAAREVFLSPSYLSSVFSSEMGMSFTAFVQTVRVEKSKELLRESRLQVAEIASETGFADQSYFTKVFTRSVGVSPTQFRRQAITARVA